MQCVVLLVMVLATGLVAQEAGIPLERWRDGLPAGRGELRSSGPEIGIRIEDRETRLEARVRLRADGSLEQLSRELRRTAPDGLIGRIEVDAEAGGYRVREEGPLGSRVLRIAGGAVETIVDPACPELLVVALLRPRQGLVPLLVLATGEVRAVEVRVEAPGRRRLQWPGTEAVAEWDPEGRFQRLALRAEGSLEVRAGTSTRKPPSPVVEETVALGGDGEPPVAAVFTQADAAQPPGPWALILPDAGTNGPDGGGRGLAAEPLPRGLAAELAKRGIPSLRVERRGGAQGDASPAVLVADAARGLSWLRARSEAAGAGRGFAVIAHGEGALVALRLAPMLEETTPLVLLAPPLQSLARRLELRLRTARSRLGDPPQAIEAAVAALREDFVALRSLPATEDPGPGRRYLREVLDVDPVHLLLGARRPALIVAGTRDEEAHSELGLLRSALAFAGPQPLRVQALEGLDAEFCDATGEVGPDLHLLLQSFLGEHAGKPR